MGTSYLLPTFEFMMQYSIDNDDLPQLAHQFLLIEAKQQQFLLIGAKQDLSKQRWYVNTNRIVNFWVL